MLACLYTMLHGVRKSHYGNHDFSPLANFVYLKVIINKTLYWKLPHYGSHVTKMWVADTVGHRVEHENWDFLDITIHIHLKLFLIYKLWWFRWGWNLRPFRLSLVWTLIDHPHHILASVLLSSSLSGITKGLGKQLLFSLFKAEFSPMTHTTSLYECENYSHRATWSLKITCIQRMYIMPILVMDFHTWGYKI